jgi:hypothetical protein
MLDANLSMWEKFIGVPHYSVDLPGYPKGDGMEGTPIGLGKDPLNVYSVQTMDGEPVLAISGQIYGGLTTKRIYSDYHFKTEFKWGEKKYEPRLDAKRDNGILYHAYGEHGKMWNVWMSSQEFQVQEADMGDFFALMGPAMDIRAAYRFQEGEEEWIYDPNAEVKSFGHGSNAGRCRRGMNAEKPHGEWNTFELICKGDTAIHVVNGKVVMRLYKSRYFVNGAYAPLTSGKIQIQSEGAECYYRRMQIKSISEIPAEYR